MLTSVCQTLAGPAHNPKTAENPRLSTLLHTESPFSLPNLRFAYNCKMRIIMILQQELKVIPVISMVNSDPLIIGVFGQKTGLFV
jgi:hypothetical protein